MGAFFLSYSLGNLLAGLLAGRFDPNAIDQMPGLYLQIAIMSFIAAIIFLLFLKPTREMMGDVE